MSLLTELSCTVLKTDDAILLDAVVADPVKSIAYLTVQDGDTVALPLNAQTQYVVFNPIDNTSLTAITVTTTIDVSASAIGDQLIIMASCLVASLFEAVEIILPSGQMLLSKCGKNNISSNIIMGPVFLEVVHAFTFDGTQFVCGFDNC
jgi:hypothetical protein